MRLLRDRFEDTRSGDSGVTVLELVVASAILLISSVSVIGALTFAGTASAQTSVRTRALNLANQRIEQARNIPYDSVGTVWANGMLGNPPGTIPATATVGPFAVSTRVDWATDPVTMRSQYKNIQVTVSWERPRPGSVSVSSAIYGKSYLVNLGDLEVRVRDAESGEPIPAAEVVAHRAGFNYLAITPPSGNAYFGGLSSGLTSVTVNAAGYIFDDSELASVTIVPEVVTSVVARGQRASSATILIVDASGKRVAQAKVLLTPGSGKAKTAAGDGEVSFADLFVGEYSVVVSAPNRTPAASTLKISRGGELVYLTVILGEPALPGSLSVQVRDPSGTGLDGALVDLWGPAPFMAPVLGSPLLSVNGESVFGGLVPGDYRASVSLPGYSSATASATVTNSMAHYLTVVLTPTGGGTDRGSLRIVVERSGSPAAGVGVQITYPNSTSITRTTDSGGEILLGNLVPGRYFVRPSGGSISEHTVLAGQETIARVSL